jgi:hypothetical protein
MNFHDKSGPAFPVTLQQDGPPALVLPGMSLRDWFAGQALVGMCVCAAIFDEPSAATHAYKLADAMLAARERERGE